ncbi:MAG: hypothetical protein Q7R57_05280 [Dehalococcoidales bacterium]|nr:hypothetical protein [Dehalococcoidales bacterium]
MATICELEYLIKLDENGISEDEQDIYLCYRGFKTGAPVSFEEIGRAYGLPVDEVDRVIFKVEESLVHG